MLKRHTWWLFWLPSYFWITITPCIYYPEGIDPTKYPAVVAHECVHLRQQEDTNLFWWLLCYGFLRNFRLRMEAEAFAEEIRTAQRVHAPSVAVSILKDACTCLAGWQYFWAAPSPEYARAAIERFLNPA